MLTKETLELIRQLRSGHLDQPQTSVLEQLPANEFVADLKSKYPIVFQERRVGHKHEVGLARAVSLELARRQIPNSYFSMLFLMPVLRRCIFVSSYNDRITEITMVANMQVVPAGGDSLDVTLKMERGHKLDKRPDGWFVKTLKKRPVTVTESFLSDRGWNFKVFDIKNIAGISS